MSPQFDLAVVGAGITGLAAAWEAVLSGASVAVFDPGAPGGKLETTPFDGGTLDGSADAFLARVPEALALCAELGIAGDLVSPATRTAYVFSRGALRPFPTAHVMGVPTDLEELAASGIVSPAGLARARHDLRTPLVAPAGDVTVGALIRERLGDEVLDRLVGPLVGGINAGDPDQASLAATLPQLDEAVRSGAGSLIAACRAQLAAVPDPAAPVFYAPRGGMVALVDALVAALRARGAVIQRAAVGGLDRAGAGWALALADPGEQGSARPARPPREVAAGAVLLTAPPSVAAALVRRQAPCAADLLGAIPSASVVMVSLAVPEEGIDRELDASGFLVPRVEGLLLTACSWATAKWAHLRKPGIAWLRASAGHNGDERALAMRDEELVDHLLADLAETMGLRARPRELRVRRWPASLPQYRPGHLERLAALEADLAERAPRLAATGAAFRGLGIPACIRQGRATARTLLGL